MALALYRRYRPDTFEGVIGQDQVTVPLMRALDEGKLTHAYLFSGPRGCGKTSSARILARCVNCAKGPTSHPCGECESCKDLATGGPGSIDVVEIDAASHNGVDDARELRERAGFAPARDRYKIFILDEAHMVTQQGFNALLKIVEEPPEHVMFIFATTEPDKVIGTIRSRTHHYPFRLVPQEVMGPYLETICDKEGIKPEPGVLKLAMRAGGGSMRDTLSVLDQLMVGSVEGVITHDAAVALLGFTPEALIGEAVDAVIDHNGEALYGVIQKVVVGGFDPRRFVEDLLARVRDLLVLTLAGDRADFPGRTKNYLEGLACGDQREWDTEFVHQKTGEHRWFHVVAMGSEVEGQTKHILVLSDRTADRQANQALSDAVAAAENANRAKSTFLSNMSHDIRTPMNAIIGFTTLAVSQLDDRDRVKDYLTKILASGNHLLSLINDILDMSRIESGKIQLDETEVNLSDVLHDIKTIVSGQFYAKQLELYMDAIDTLMTK